METRNYLQYKKKNPVVIESCKKKLCKNFGLERETEKFHRVVKVLDIKPSLNNGKFKLFHKANENLKYVSHRSNHPELILQSIPRSMYNRISRLSAYKWIWIFNMHPEYNSSALARAGYKDRIVYVQNRTVDVKYTGSIINIRNNLGNNHRIPEPRKTI